MQQLAEIERAFPGMLKRGVSFREITSMRVGGRVLGVLDLHVLDNSILRFTQDFSDRIDWYCIGDGTNLIASDVDHPLLLVRLSGREARVTDTEIVVSAPVKLAEVVSLAARSGLSGMEPFAGIPGTVGGAVRMNAGTRDYWMDRVVKEVEVVQGGIRTWVDYSTFDPSYRSTRMDRGTLVTRVKFELEKAPIEVISEKMNGFITRRKATQPLGVPSSGSIFKNPEGDSAGRLIEACGLKGKRIGGARISEIHANFIVNIDDGSFDDVLSLMQLAEERVEDRFGIKLEREVIVLQ